MIYIAMFICGWLIGPIADRRFAHIQNDPIRTDMVYTMHLLPDPKQTFYKYLLQSIAHMVTGKGGRRSTVTTLDGRILHGFDSKGIYRSRELLVFPLNAKFRLKGPCHESTLKKLKQRNGERFNWLLNNCRWSI